MDPDKVIDIVMLGVGIAIIAFAMTRAKALGGAPLEFTAKVGSLRADRVALLVLVGLAFSSVGVFFRVRDYEGRLETLTKDQNGTKAGLEVLQSQLDRMKEYDLTIALEFHDPVDLNTLKVTMWIRGADGANYKESKQAIDAQRDRYASNRVLLRLSNLKKGDHIRIEGDEGSRHWESPEIEVPTFNFGMTEKSKL